MISQKFEIKVALLGYVSVGKTTVLNAILRDKFSEVSMRRTTAGINFFRLISPEKNEKTTSSSSQDDSGEAWPAVVDEATQDASDVLREIVTTNQKLREAGRIEEKWFNIELEDPLCEMRKDTTLVLVDIPGINEADSDGIYTKYVEDNWKSFDCIVAVMDARQGANTEEQLQLLHLIKKNLSAKKEIPTLILFNKVDEPDDSELNVLLQESQVKVAQLFSVGCRVNALKQILDAKACQENLPSDVYPVVITTSAIHAFFYRAASLLSFEDFKKKFDMDLIDTIGREEVGRFRWKKLSAKDKYEVVYKSVREHNSYKERLEATNFNVFLVVLSLAVGGSCTQTKILEKQIDVAIETLVAGETVTVDQLRCIHDRSLILNKDMASLKSAFWSVYRSFNHNALSKLDREGDILALAGAVKMLENFYCFIRQLKWKRELEVIRHEACSLFRQQLEILTKKPDLKTSWNLLRDKCDECMAGIIFTAVPTIWEKLRPHDWLVIFDSLLLLSYDRVFCEVFGREKILLSQLRYRIASSLFPPLACGCSYCGNRSYAGFRSPCCIECDRELRCFLAALDPSLNSVPNSLKSKRGKTRKRGLWQGPPDWSDPACPSEQPELDFTRGSLESISNQLIVDIPNSLSSPNHWGHVAWMCCKLVGAIDIMAIKGDCSLA